MCTSITKVFGNNTLQALTTALKLSIKLAAWIHPFPFSFVHPLAVHKLLVVPWHQTSRHSPWLLISTGSYCNGYLSPYSLIVKVMGLILSLFTRFFCFSHCQDQQANCTAQMELPGALQDIHLNDLIIDLLRVIAS